jgi:DNA-binding FrmR family transcriptional regulator
MAHIQRDRKKLLARINRLMGQLAAIKTLLEQDEHTDQDRCYEVMRQLSSIKGALRGLMSAYLEGFVLDHMQMAAEEQRMEEFADEFLDIVRSFQS